MPIVNADGTVTRSGQLLLEQLQAPTTIEGTHATRPDPSTVPDGSIYVEFDRGVLYCNENGTWQYIAGTMYALLNPDQRPTDLGPNDAGFEFRSIDTDPDYAPRQFLWSQSEWVETTMVLYGTHAARPAADEKTPPRTLYVEEDRGAIYQHQAGVWQYLAGTMWGTFSPDQRPTDLGTHDAGFDYRTTDAPPREFIWSQTGWIQTTPIAGGQNLIHPNVVTKVGSSSNQIVEGGITDLSPANSASICITAGGHIGIQTTSPNSLLDVNTPTISANTDVLTLTAGTTTVNGAEQRIKFNSSSVYQLGYIGVGFDPGGPGASGYMAFGNGTNSPAVERMRIAGSGNIGIGTTAPGHMLEVGSDSAGKPGTNTWTIVSDMRTKRNVARFEGDIKVIRRLDPIVAEYNGKGGTPEGMRVVSFDAAKLREIVPQAVSSVRGKLDPDDGGDTDLLGINTHEIFFHILRAIQYLDREVERLKAP